MLPRFCSASRRSCFRSMGRLVANVSDDEAPKVPSEFVSRLTKNSVWNSEAQGDLAQQRDEKFKNLAEDVKLTPMSDDAGSTRSVSVGKFFVTTSAFMLDYGVSSSCREYTYPRNDDRAYPKNIINNNTKIGPVLELLVTIHFDRYGIGMKMDSLVKDVTQCWVVISRDVEKCVTELPVATRSQYI